MKLNLSIFFFIGLFINVLSAQNDNMPYVHKEVSQELGELVYGALNLEKYPEFPGGDTAMIRFINENLHYPADARENYLEGTVL